MNNNEFETLGITNDNPQPNVNPTPAANPMESQAEKLDMTAENIINEVNQEINANPVATPVSEPAPAAPQPEVEPQLQAMPAEAPADTTAPADDQDDMGNISYETKDTYNEFANEKPKKKTSLTSVVILILLLLVLFGSAYYSIIYKDSFNLGLGGKSSKTTALAAKDVTLELGSEIPTDITFYMNKSLKETEYKLTTNKINNNVAGEYTFEVTYNGKSYTGKVTVSDTTAPDLVTKDLTVADVNNLTADDFVDNCTDFSGCTVSFTDDFDLSKYAEAGTYEIVLVAKDNYSNTKQVKANLTVDANATPIATNILKCTYNKKSSDYAATRVVLYEATFDDNDTLTKFDVKETYTFDNAQELAKYKAANATATGTYDDAALTYKTTDSLDATQFATKYPKFPSVKADLKTTLSGIANVTCE